MQQLTPQQRAQAAAHAPIEHMLQVQVVVALQAPLQRLPCVFQFVGMHGGFLCRGF
ncbi:MULTISPECIES: hypothetical protein [Xanthomonas translucens group]|uniref:hypothetical protein n=1 Tax=Xanthomonas translucens group TaxID=3390202 RepID=UPI001E2BEBE8|nr:hypothetical protein [Xanthomonas translucens]